MRSNCLLHFKITINSNLYYNDAVKQFIVGYNKPTQSYINYSNNTKIKSESHSVAKQKVNQYFKYIKFIKKYHFNSIVSQKSVRRDSRNYPILNDGLIKKILKLRPQTKFNLIDYKIEEIQRLQNDKFQGVFVHRELNLPQKYYQVIKKKNITYKLKKLDIEGIKKDKQRKTQYQKMIRDSIYDDFQDFISSGVIDRSLYAIKLWSLISQNNNNKRQHQSCHLFQLERIDEPRIIDPYFLTDFDFLMNGNAFVN